MVRVMYKKLAILTNKGIQHSSFFAVYNEKIKLEHLGFGYKKLIVLVTK